MFARANPGRCVVVGRLGGEQFPRVCCSEWDDSKSLHIRRDELYGPSLVERITDPSGNGGSAFAFINAKDSNYNVTWRD